MANSHAELRIVTNRGGARVFKDLREVREFSAATSQDLAMLTAVVEASTLDECYITQMLGLANDLAFQLQQSVTLICEAEVERG
jgi:hypothetical protein